MRKNKVTNIVGYGRLTGPANNGIHSISVEIRRWRKENSQGEKCGDRHRLRRPPVARGGSGRDRILTNMEILVLPQIPKSMVVIGAGAVGVEFGSIFKSFGSEITIVEYLPRLVPNEDEDVSKELARVFRKRGIDTHTGAKVGKCRENQRRGEGDLHHCRRQAGGEGSGESTGGRRPGAPYRRYWPGGD